jgi:CO/xanthine dehydrogenase Mo-binding subunit
MPLSHDAPKVDVIHVITEDPNVPYGAKEPSNGLITSSPPAVLSAIHDATGLWFKRLPVTPEDIVRELQKKKSIT